MRFLVALVVLYLFRAPYFTPTAPALLKQAKLQSKRRKESQPHDLFVNSWLITFHDFSEWHSRVYSHLKVCTVQLESLGIPLFFFLFQL